MSEQSTPESGSVELPPAAVRTSVRIPLQFGDGFRTEAQVFTFDGLIDGQEHVALGLGRFAEAQVPLVRLHSECLTGDALGSLRCDCRDQLEVALRRLSSMPRGLLLYLRQEGRGIGLRNKVRAYALQDRGLDTVEANRALGFRDDERDYEVAAHMLASLNVESIALMTNNPDKIAQLQRYGVKIAHRIPHVIPPNEFNRDYLLTKALRSGHQLEIDGKPVIEEQDDPVVIEQPGAST